MIGIALDDKISNRLAFILKQDATTTLFKQNISQNKFEF